MATDDDFNQMRNDEIFALCVLYSDSCTKENENAITFSVLESDFKDKKIKFQVKFIDSYPKERRPDYTLTADWLPTKQIELLKYRLDELWNENLNQPIVFLWIESMKAIVLKWLEEADNSNGGDEAIKEIEEDLNRLNFEFKNYDKERSKVWKIIIFI